jgi:hypothetical protein
VHQQKAHQRHADDDRDHIDDTTGNVDEHGITFSQSSRIGSRAGSEANKSFIRHARACPGHDG